ncbi:transposon Tf2-6 polyprotein [Trichonephila clavipes]|nr:transposon Tf2-6 polyprotein [Trichonephila clavipes]
MSFHKNTRKEDLINALKEIGEQATSKGTMIELKTKLEKSAAFKDDPDFVIDLLNLSVEDRQAKAERQLKNRVNMGYTNQFQRQFPKHNQSVRADKTVSCYICGGSHFARNCTKKTMNSEKRNTDTGHAVNQIGTSISNQNNFLFNELQYVDVIVDDTPLRATLDSGANSVIINSKYVSEGKRIHSQIVLTSCFGEKRSANVSEFTISLKGGEKKKILAAVCRIEAAILLPSKVFEFLKSKSEEAGSTNASCKPVCLQNETEGEDDVELTGGVANLGKITDVSNLFLLKVLETFDECLYGIRNKVQTLIENYSPDKTETTALKMKIILSDEKPIAQRSRRLSLPEKREVENKIDEWLEQGIIRESCSNFSSPVVVCKKKDGTSDCV